MQDRRLFLTEAVKTPYLPVCRRIKEIIDDGQYGKIRYMEFNQSYTSGPYLEGWNRMKEYGCGVLYGNEAHFFAMAQFFAGRMISCNGTLSCSEEETEDQAGLSALMENHAIATLDVSAKVLFKNGLVIYLDHARMELPDYWKADTANIYVGNKLIETIHIPCKHEFQYELAHHNECMQKGLLSSSVTPIETSIQNIALVEEIYRCNKA